MNEPETTASPAPARNVNLLPWAAPVLGVYNAAPLTQGISDQSSDGFINTHS
ncbi:hypothetical protein [Tistrella sp.]|uniref:hypothetical protein n=1 Tax=Tistrella sp. TaxID=2024861 RepID=UPI0025CC191B|nr:hypothetical protein [Tistrella sp.]